jgi:hypothetical protein
MSRLERYVPVFLNMIALFFVVVVVAVFAVLIIIVATAITVCTSASCYSSAGVWLWLSM